VYYVMQYTKDYSIRFVRSGICCIYCASLTSPKELGDSLLWLTLKYRGLCYYYLLFNYRILKLFIIYLILLKTSLYISQDLKFSVLSRQRLVRLTVLFYTYINLLFSPYSKLRISDVVLYSSTCCTTWKQYLGKVVSWRNVRVLDTRH
jgi:hypothetical protein